MPTEQITRLNTRFLSLKWKSSMKLIARHRAEIRVQLQANKHPSLPPGPRPPHP